MPVSSLRDIEKTMTGLWMRRDARDGFLNGSDGEIDASIAAEIDKDGVELYASLLSFGHHDVMISIYPLTARLLGTQWQGVVENYLETYPPNHFNLNRAAKRFAQYLEEHEAKLCKRFPYLPELADYEWIELELLENNQDAPGCDLSVLQSPEQFGEYAPIVNPAVAIRRYRYPIIKITEQLETGKRLPRNVQPVATNVIAYRDPAEHRCRFMDAGDVAAAVVETAKNCPTPYTDLIALAVSMAPAGDPQSVIVEFLELVENLQASHLLLGNQKLA